MPQVTLERPQLKTRVTDKLPNEERATASNKETSSVVALARKVLKRTCADHCHLCELNGPFGGWGPIGGVAAQLEKMDFLKSNNCLFRGGLVDRATYVGGYKWA